MQEAEVSVLYNSGQWRVQVHEFQSRIICILTLTPQSTSGVNLGK